MMFFSSSVFSLEEVSVSKANEEAPKTEALKDLCLKTLGSFPGPEDKSPDKKKNTHTNLNPEPNILAAVCSQMRVLSGCESVEKVPIYHYEKMGSHKSKQKILVFSLIHGDETPAGSVARFWLERLETINPRNSWRVVPVLNPDGLKRKTRTNANGVDVNRNFPTRDWVSKAVSYWKTEAKQNPRRFPGPTAGSEPETRCALKHIEEFKPDLIVSVHTPLKVLDFDGPKVQPPKFEYLPWKSLGNYPGSLGRYMWFERKKPVLTMEMKEDLPSSTKPFLELQDIIGFLVSLEFGQLRSPDKKTENLPASPVKK